MSYGTVEQRLNAIEKELHQLNKTLSILTKNVVASQTPPSKLGNRVIVGGDYVRCPICGHATKIVDGVEPKQCSFCECIFDLL